MFRTALCATVLAACTISHAQQSFAFRKQDIRAGVVLLPTNPLSTNPADRYFPSNAPHVLYNLDLNQSVKPAGWNLFNPRSSGTLQLEDYNRWVLRDASLNTPDFLARVNAGLRLQKSHAAYWEVKLDNATDFDLADYDFLVVSPVGIGGSTVQIDAESREKLRKFVDKGGILWVDAAAANFDLFNGFPIPFATVGTLSPAWTADFRQPILRIPNALNSNDLGQLVSSGVRTIQSPGNVYGGGILAPLLQPLLGANNGLGGQPTGDFAKVASAISFGNNSALSVGRIGEGYIVITSRDIAAQLNRTASDANFLTNTGFFAKRPTLTQPGVTAAKFVVNAISLGSEANASGGSSRRSGSTAVDLGAPLVRTFSDTYPTGQNPVEAPWVPRPPVFYKGMTFVVGTTQVMAYDAEPRSDINRDGNPDDGFPDLSLGEDKDLVFRTQPIAGGISSATCISVPDARTAAFQDQLLVTDNQGGLHIFPIFINTPDGSGNIPGITITGAVSPAPSTLGNPAFPPTVHEGLAYVPYTTGRTGSPQGAFWVADLRTGQPVIGNAGTTFRFLGGNDPSTRIPEWASSPVVGYIPISDGSGGYDKVLYAPTMGDGTTPAGFVSIWLGAKGERPANVELNGSELLVTTRLRDRNNLGILTPGTASPLGFRITVQDVNGVPASPAQMENLFTGAVSLANPSTLRIGLTAAGQAINPADWNGRIRIDYTADLGFNNPADTINAMRGFIRFPVNPNGPRQVISGLALSPAGSLFATTSLRQSNPIATAPASPTAAGGSLFAFKELALGQFQMTYRWDLAIPGTTLTPSGAEAFTVQDPIPDNDPVQYLQFGSFRVGNFIGGPLRNPVFVGGPVVRNGNVYCTVIGNKSGFVRASAVLCFQAEPPIPEIQLPQDIGPQFTVVQPDLARAGNPLAPSTQDESRLTTNEVRYERGPNNTGSVLRFINMMGSTNGQILNSISTSLPVFIRRNGQPDLVVDPMRTGNRWNPLQWYTILPGTALNGPVFVTGNTIFASGSSALPKILEQQIPLSQNDFDGLNFAMQADIDLSNAVSVAAAASTDITNFAPRTLIADANRPWLRQVISMDYPRTNPVWTAPQADISAIYPNQYVVWPQTPRNTEARGKMSFDDYKLRVLQAIVPTNNSYGVVAGDGTLMAWNALGVFGYRKAETWIADEGRVGLYDSVGNVLFDSNFSLRFAEMANGNAGQVSKLVRPTRILPVAGTSDVLVVDSGANRVLRMSTGGLVSRTIENLTVDDNYAPNGFRPGDPLTLSNPRDVAFFTTYVAAAQNVFGNARPLEQWNHYVIADSGNNRLVEVLDRFEVDNAGNFIQVVGTPGTLVWQSQSEVTGKGFAYNSVSILNVPDDTNTLRPVYICGVGGKLPRWLQSQPGATNPDKSNAENSGGGVIIFDSRLPTGYTVYNGFNVPGIQAVRRWNDRTGTWTQPSDPEAQVISTTNPAANKPAEVNRPFLNLQSVTASYGVPSPVPGSVPSIRIMVSDSTGVYEMAWNPRLAPTQRAAQDLTATWMINSDAYRAMRQSNIGPFGSPNFAPIAENPDRFFPTFARRLDDDNVLIVNGYVGQTRGRRDTATGNWITRPSRFNGEVIQLDGRIALVPQPRNPLTTNGFNFDNDNLGFNSRSIRFRLGPIEGGRELSLPVFADRK